jgi:signal peptidase I
MARLSALGPWLVVFVALFAAGGLTALVLQPVRVAGSSMSPALEPGDVVFVAARAPVGLRDVVLIRRPGHGAVLHRIVAPAGGAGWVTRGDANPIPDFEPVPASAVQGKVVAVARVGSVARRWREALLGATLANQSDSTRR